LQNTPGEISAEDQALLDAAELKAGEAATRVESVAAALAALDDLTPPPPPTEPTE
jgi:hypothetical protein